LTSPSVVVPVVAAFVSSVPIVIVVSSLA